MPICHFQSMSVNGLQMLPACSMRASVTASLAFCETSDSVLWIAHEEHSLPWTLNGTKVKEANLPFHVRQALKRGEHIEFDGQTLQPENWGTAPRNAKSYVFSSDTRPCQSLLNAAKGATLMYHDATFSMADSDRAKATYHSTTIEAARLARQAGVKTGAGTHQFEVQAT